MKLIQERENIKCSNLHTNNSSLHKQFNDKVVWKKQMINTLHSIKSFLDNHNSKQIEIEKKE